jgi:alpha-ketoglutarate-dependent taurine dioxygenase
MLRIEASDATLGATVTGAKLDALSEAEWRAIESAFLEHAVLIFPAQHLSREAQVTFGRRFGELDSLVAKTGTVPISNLKADGTLMEETEPAKQLLRGNEGWHTDSSYMPVSAKASLLSAEVVTESGGETEWADMRAAWEALDAATRARIEELSAYHSIRYSQARASLISAPGGALYYGFDGSDAPLRPLVKRHPVTRRPALFIGRHAYGIPGLAPADSERLLDELLAVACRPPRVLRHVWQPGDLALWDNRCVLHRARPYDPKLPRVLHHTRIAGDPRSESALPRAPRGAQPSAST